MPRPNEGRRINSEANLARRIAFERAERGWTYERLAQKMTEAGCQIAASAIYKIEKGEPPRRVTVDEMVALALVLEVTYEDLLAPVDGVRDERLISLATEMEEILAAHYDQQWRLLKVFSKIAAHQLWNEIEVRFGHDLDYYRGSYMPDISDKAWSDAVWVGSESLDEVVGVDGQH